MRGHLPALLGLCTWLLLGAGAGAQVDLRLVLAAEQRDMAAVRVLLRQKANPDSADREGMTALLWAAHWNDLDMVQALLAAGANPNAANRYGVAPLHEAATVRNAAMVRVLLQAGADPDAAYGEGETPLMIAARAGSLDAVRLLIEAGADVNAAESFRGLTPLMYAAVENHADIVRALVAAGADPNARTVRYTFQKLVGGAGGIIHDRPEGNLTALILAARQGAIEAGEALLSAGADIDAEEPQYGFTPLQTAIFNGHYRFARMLIARGANVNDGSLYVAVEMRNLATYSNRPNPPASDGGVTHLDIIQLLLDKGADPNRPYAKRFPPRQAQGEINPPPGSTPLYRAARSIDLTAVQLLLDAGANPSQALDDGSTPLMAAAGLGAPRSSDEVVEAGDRNDPVEVLQLLVARGADVNAANKAGMTALHYAAQRGSERVIEFLARQGARLDAKNGQGRTPVDLARGRTAEFIRRLASPSP